MSAPGVTSLQSRADFSESAIPTLLDARVIEAFLSHSNGHLLVDADPTPNFQRIWTNPTAHRIGEAHASLAVLEEGFRCSQVAGTGIAGVADRYGGFGIGRNGGSGRAAIVAGLHVKGIGKTPLVDAGEELGHASGGAYLEECVREAIFSRLFGMEFPFGAVPTLALYTTGFTQEWPEGIFPRREQRCLLARPLFLRPAHFDRAIGFGRNDPLQGTLDDQRVAAMLRCAVSSWGADSTVGLFMVTWLRWAEQLAYGFVHRLSHAGSTESNVAIGGALLDFGAATSLPSWAPFLTVESGFPAGTEWGYVLRAVELTAPHLARHVHPSLQGEEFLSGARANVCARFHQRVAFEFLRLLGFTRTQASKVLSSPSARAVHECAMLFFSRSGKSERPIFAGLVFQDCVLSDLSLWDLREEFGELEKAYQLGKL